MVYQTPIMYTESNKLGVSRTRYITDPYIVKRRTIIDACVAFPQLRRYAMTYASVRQHEHHLSSFYTESIVTQKY